VSNTSVERLPSRVETAIMAMFDKRIHPSSEYLTNQEAMAVHKFLQTAFPDLFGLAKIVSDFFFLLKSN
jgi:hypothetical protein